MDVPAGMEVIPNGWEEPVRGYPLGHDCWWMLEVDQDGNEVGIVHWHRDPVSGKIHAGGALFDTPAGRAVHPTAAHWQLVSREPLTLAPSLLCSCGHHGHIQEGQWVPC